MKIGMKRCSKCRQVKPHDDFPRSSGAVDGRYCYCRPCNSAIGKTRLLRLKSEKKSKAAQAKRGGARAGQLSHPTKICSMCKVDLPVDNFQRNRCSSDGLRSECRSCTSEAKATRPPPHGLGRTASRGRALLSAPPTPRRGTAARSCAGRFGGASVPVKTCTGCNQEKSTNDYYRRAGSKDGLRSQCKTCIAAFEQARRAKLNQRRPAQEMMPSGRATRSVGAVAALPRISPGRDLPTSEPSKVCGKCRIAMPRPSFFRDPARKDGLRSYCKPCTQAYKSSRKRALARVMHQTSLTQQHAQPPTSQLTTPAPSPSGNRAPDADWARPTKRRCLRAPRPLGRGGEGTPAAADAAGTLLGMSQPASMPPSAWQAQRLRRHLDGGADTGGNDNSKPEAVEARVRMARLLLTHSHRLSVQAKMLQCLGPLECAALLEGESLPDVSCELVLERFTQLMEAAA